MGTVNDLFASYSGKSIVYCPNPGNGGDALIAEATFRLLDRHHVNYSIYDWNPERLKPTDHFFFGGGGNLVSTYPEASKIPFAVHKRVDTFVILPHSIEGHSDLLSDLNSNSIVFARESISHKYLKNFSNIGALHLDHDMAFSLFDDSDFIRKCKLQSLLLFPFFLNVLRRKRKAYSLGQRSPLRQLSVYREDREKSSIVAPWDNFDLSKYVNYDSTMRNRLAVAKTASRIPAMLNWFSHIKTNRIHISVSALLMKKRVDLHPNSYWKNRAIFDQSINSRFKNITFVDSTSGTRD